jgi:GNAT superfamily N-acetyltransferase
MEERYLDEVLQIYTHYVLNTTATFHARPPTREEMRKMVFFDREYYRTFVICDGEKVCGYVYLAQHKAREAYDGTAEVSVYLRPDYTGQGLGSLALKTHRGVRQTAGAARPGGDDNRREREKHQPVREKRLREMRPLPGGRPQIRPPARRGRLSENHRAKMNAGRENPAGTAGFALWAGF